MFNWEEGDRFSFEDSERFEDDSMCSYISDPDSLCNNWRGWKKQNIPTVAQNPMGQTPILHPNEDGVVPTLVELAARQVGFHIPFEHVERVCPPVPEQLQLRIAVWSFPENEEDIRLYSCLANGSGDEFIRGESFFKVKAVHDPLQIGFHLSATVVLPQSIGNAKGTYNVAITFDRKRITSCDCTCNSTASWCAHVVAMCLHRIHLPNQVCLRAPVSESLSRLSKVQLRKFAQYLIYEQPQQILPTAQRLLDELLSNKDSPINNEPGAPDPTAGAALFEQTTWCLDESTLHDNIHKILIKFCVPSPIVFSDVNYLSTTAPPAAAEWTSLLRPLRGREPEGMWNLLSIVREMFRRHDRNAVPLLEILTEECLACDQVLIWWFNTAVSSLTSSGNNNARNNGNSSIHSSQHACSSLSDEIVVLWRLAALNPALSPTDRIKLCNQLKIWHLKTVDKVCKVRGGSNTSISNVATGGSVSVNTSLGPVRKSEVEIFPGFKPALEGCLLDWKNYAIMSITYEEGNINNWYHNPLTHARSFLEPCRDISSSPAVLSCDTHHTYGLPLLGKRGRSVEIGQSPSSPNPACLHSCSNAEVLPIDNSHICGFKSSRGARGSGNQPYNNNDGNSSSMSSEGFCESENLDLIAINLDEASTSKSGVVITVNDSSERQNVTDESSCDDTLPLNISGTSNNNSKSEKNQKDKKGDDLDSDSSSGINTNANEKPTINKREISSKVVSEPAVNSSEDQYLLCIYDINKTFAYGEGSKNSNSYCEDIFDNVKKVEDPIEVLFARAEALHAHGHSEHACTLAIQLAEEILKNPPDLIADTPTQCVKGKRNKRVVVNSASHQVSCLASATLAKAAFLCTVLSENPDHHHLAFRVGMFGLEIPRPPASTKALEVKLTNQESDLVTLLKKLPLGVEELKVIKDKAVQLKDGSLPSRGEALLPLILASFIFDALCLIAPSSKKSVDKNILSNEDLGFQAAVSALGLKANVSEADHPLLCEGTRRQRGELAITLLVNYKDDSLKLNQIMDKLLDKEVHCMYKSSPSPVNSTPAVSSNNNTVPIASNSSTTKEDDQSVHTLAGQVESVHITNGAHKKNIPGSGVSASTISEGRSTTYPSSTGTHTRNLRKEIDNRNLSSPTWEEDYNAWKAKFRCTNLKTMKKHSEGMASIDSSAPETTSSDNSPTMVRRHGWTKPVGPGSESGSSGKSSDSFASSSSGTGLAPADKSPVFKGKPREMESPKPAYPSVMNRPIPTQYHPLDNGCRNFVPAKSRFKAKKAFPNIPNQPSEASAHFMLELAKTVLAKAGGNSSTSLFTQASTSQNHRGPHRALHMSAFQIGVYALGLHNRVSPNWLSRTYSSQVSWITGQAMEIGSAAIAFLINTWEGHLTPPEVATLADKASSSRDSNMVRAAADLALSCLPHAHALNPTEVHRALIQCKEQSNEMLERACYSVETAAKGGGVYPDVLFDVSRRWYELYELTLEGEDNSAGSELMDQHAFGAFQMDSSPYPTFTMGDPHLSIMSPVTANQHHLIPPPPTITYSAIAPMPPTPLPYQTVTSAPGPYNYIHQAIPTAGPTIFGQGTLHPVTSPFPAAGYIQAGPNVTQATYQYANRIQLAVPTSTYYSLANAGSSQIPTRTLASIPNAIYAANAQIRPMAHALPPHMPQLQQQPPPHAIRPNSQQHGSHFTQTQLNYLLAGYRLGMLAMETLARRVHDDRPQTKYARSPPYGEDIKWILKIAKKIGTAYLHQFCIATVNSVASPFVLQEIAIEAAYYLARNTPAAAQHLRSPILTPLIQKCQQMYIQCAHMKMYHIASSEFEEFISILMSARSAFQMTPGGIVQFNELLHSLCRSKSCKKELRQRITSTFLV